MITQEAGIYKIINIVNNKEYIGSSLNMPRRHYDHLSHLRRNTHHSKKLQASYNKYGEESFVFETIEKIYFNENCTKEYKIQYLESLEQYYLDLYKSYLYGYNCSLKTGYPGIPKSKETVLKANETRKRNNTKHSQETKDRISFVLKNSEKRKKANETLHFNNRIKVYQYDLEGNFIKEWSSKHEVCNALNIKYANILETVRRENSSLNGFIFKNYKKEKIPGFVNGSFKKINVLDKDFNLLFTFKSIADCGRYLNIKSNAIYTSAKRNTFYKKQYYFKHE